VSGLTSPTVTGSRVVGFGKRTSEPSACCRTLVFFVGGHSEDRHRAAPLCRIHVFDNDGLQVELRATTVRRVAAADRSRSVRKPAKGYAGRPLDGGTLMLCERVHQRGAHGWHHQHSPLSLGRSPLSCAFFGRWRGNESVSRDVSGSRVLIHQFRCMTVGS
jgi:hypothetical protein